ncbi:protein kinase [Streptomyces cadmiisoli]|uniref:protein kinase n=1 Tax=Streptomyces cadmiisoli TaxID=2184053 RepID=UPI001FEAACFD|nr:protein kinase [Streptomyces cadmiisoli]
MEDYAGRVLADRYRLPLPPSDEYELTETRAFDTYSGQEVLVRQVPLPEVVEAEVLDAEGLPDGFTARDRGARRTPAPRAGTRRPTDPAVRRAVEAAQAAARIPDHPRLDQVFDVFAEGGSLWIVSEWVASRPLAALLAEQPLTPYRAAEVASDVLTALRVLHAHGWVHRNITARTVLVCDDGRVMLTGLAVGAAEEALCGYDPVPEWMYGADEGGGAADPGGRPGSGGGSAASGATGAAGGAGAAIGPGTTFGPGGAIAARGAVAPGGTGGTGGIGGTGGSRGAGVPGGVGGGDPEAARRAAIEARAARGLPLPGGSGVHTPGGSAVPARRAQETGGDIRAQRAGAIAAYRAGARAAARVQEAQQSGRAALPEARSGSEGAGAQSPYTSGQAEQQTGRPALPGARPASEGGAEQPYAPGAGRLHTPDGAPPGQIADPYGVRGTPWPGGAASTDRYGQGALHGDGLARQGAPAPGHGTAVPTDRTALPSGGTDPVPAPSSWDDLVAGTPVARRGPTTALAAERARQARMAVVGPVTERWAPEQAGPVHENWRLAPPIGPSTDLWALGALLFRAVQGHAPYPEESTAELVQMVCAEPPAFAEECGPLRPVVESLLRQDPTERLDFEELRGWLRSLVRSAPEPEAGVHVVAAPPADASRLPIVRRKGELVRRRRAGLPAAHGRHKRDRHKQKTGSPRSLGRTLLVLVLLAMAGAIAYAVLFMPKAGEGGGGAGGPERTGAAGQVGNAPERTPEASSEPRPDQNASGEPAESAGSTEAQTDAPQVADGFELRTDPEGFRVAVAEGWQRTPEKGNGRVVYGKGDFELIVVPGRDGADEYGGDPMTYQREREPELLPYRESSWATSTGLKTIEVGGRTMAEGQFTWTGEGGGELFVRNLAMLVDGRYHVVQLRGPESERDEVTRLYEQAAATYRATG